MGGKLPKPPDRRARGKRGEAPWKVVEVSASPQPDLPIVYVSGEDTMGRSTKRRFVWPEVTKHWWANWATSPLASDFTDLEWEFLAQTAFLHAHYWMGDLKLGTELRQRVAKFGVTPEDRARLRISFAHADGADGGETPQLQPSRSRTRQVRRLDPLSDHGPYLVPTPSQGA